MEGERHRLLLDTGPLREAATWVAAGRGYSGLRRQLTWILSEDDLRTLRDYRRTFLGCVVPAGAVVEAWRWIRTTPAGGHATLWGILVELMAELGAQERLVEAQGLDRTEAARFGPVDASLIALARRAPRGSEIVSCDGVLVGYCQSCGLRALTLEQAVSGLR